MTRAQVKAVAIRAVEAARAECADVEFSAEDAIRTEPEFLAEVLQAAADAGATTLNIPDTVGYGLPHEITALFGALAFGIGTSEVSDVLVTQALFQRLARTMRVTVDGRLREGVTAKDLALAIIARVGIGGGTGHVVEFAGETARALDGGPHDALQREHRDGSQGRHGRARRHQGGVAARAFSRPA